MNEDKTLNNETAIAQESSSAVAETQALIEMTKQNNALKAELQDVKEALKVANNAIVNGQPVMESAPTRPAAEIAREFLKVSHAPHKYGGDTRLAELTVELDNAWRLEHDGESVFTPFGPEVSLVPRDYEICDGIRDTLQDALDNSETNAEFDMELNRHIR